MADKGKLVVEGAKFYCTNSADHNSPGTAATLNVMSQKKVLKDNKYFAHDKPIGTYLDDKATSFNNGQGFGKCITPDGKQMPCAAKCNIKYKDYYENVEFNKSMKILLDVSTGTCPGYGKKGDIMVADSGQKEKTSTIKVNEKDAFEVNAVSGQWPIANSATKTSVKSIKASVPFAANAGETLFFLDHKKNAFSFDSIIAPAAETKLQLNADYTGDESKIVWAIFKGTDTKDKVQTYIGLGKSIVLRLENLFKNLEEGKYRVEAYGSKPGDPKCCLFIDYVKNFVESITAKGDSVLRNVAMPFTLKFKVDPNDLKAKILNRTIFQAPSSVIWTVSDDKSIIYRTGAVTGTNVVRVMGSGNAATITFYNGGKYKVSATTNAEGKPFTKDITVESKLGVKSITHGDPLLRISDSISAKVANYNVAYVGDAPRTIQWYLKKGETRINVFEQSPISGATAINKKVSELLGNDAKLAGALYGNYILEAYASALPDGKDPDFKESGAYMDCYHFEVVRNSVTGANLPETIPLNANVKFTAETRLKLASDERIITEPESGDVKKNEDGTLTFTKEGEYTINIHMEGGDSDPVKLAKKVKVAAPEIKKALWSYESGYKRTETGYKEESYAFVEIAGLANQQLIGKIWLKGPDDSFYADPENKFFLEEKQLTLNEEGKGSFQVVTNDDYKTKIEKAIPPTADNPHPRHELIFTIELVATEGANVTLPADLAIKSARQIKVGEKTLYEVLDNNEVLSLTSEQKIKSIVFSDEAGKNIQRAQTFYGKTHKIWVHTVNMQDDELQVNVYKEIPDLAMTEKEGTVSALTSKKTYQNEKVGTDSMLKFDFTPEKSWNEPEKKNVDFYFVSVSKKGKDDSGKDILIPVKSQVTLSNADSKVVLVNGKDMEAVGLGAAKEDGTPFTQEEMARLRKEYLFYENGCLKVSNTTAQEVIENDISPVIVEMAEIEGGSGTCPRCTAKVTMAELKEIFTGGSSALMETCLPFINDYFEKFKINTCRRKAHFFGQVRVETDLVTLTENLKYSEDTLFTSDLAYYKGNRERSRNDARNEKSIGNNAYGSRLNNRAGTDDGYNFRGRGFIMVTGRVNYTSFQTFYDKNKKLLDLPDVTFISPTFENENPEMLAEPKYAVLSAVDFWVSKGLNEKADSKNETKALEDLVNVINSKTNSRDKRRASFQGGKYTFKKKEYSFAKGTKAIFKVPQCLKGKTSNLNLAGAAPWMPFAYEELKNFGGVRQTNSPLKEQVSVYFDSSSLPSGNHTTFWCAAFINWCFEQTDDYQGTNKAANVAAQDWAPKATAQKFRTDVDGWENGELIEKAEDVFVGAVVMFDYSHVAFIIGESEDGKKFVYLGGNQSDGGPGDGPGQRTISINQTSKSNMGTKIFISKPSDFTPSPAIKKLPKLSTSGEELDASTSR